MFFSGKMIYPSQNDFSRDKSFFPGINRLVVTQKNPHGCVFSTRVCMISGEYFIHTRVPHSIGIMFKHSGGRVSPFSMSLRLEL